ncbi:MAG: hypothetical protein U0X86_000058 [Wolbachia endosymbiont of Xenopsylla cheopis]
MLWDFIDTAHEHLKELNGSFNLDNFKQSKLYQEMKKNKVSLIDIDLQNKTKSIA